MTACLLLIAYGLAAGFAGPAALRRDWAAGLAAAAAALIIPAAITSLPLAIAACDIIARA